MKSLSLKLFFLSLFAGNLLLFAQDVTTIEATDSDISDNLDLNAVASIFGEAKDLEDFEKKLNDPNLKISNLDLNGDDEVDYIRVVETAEDNVHTISLEAVIGKDQYQEVATIVVVKDEKQAAKVQVIGNVDMYGPDYYITPVYHVIPVFFTFFWMATYHPWHSPWHWHYHPPFFRPWHPYYPHIYRSNVNIHININNSYNHTNNRIYNRTSNRTRNDYFKKHPDKSFKKRNPNVRNRADLARTRDRKAPSTRRTRDYKSTGRPVTRPSQKPGTRPSAKPSTRPSTKPSTRPSTRPSTKPSTRPSTRPSKKPSTRPSTRPSARPSTRPSARPNRSAPRARTYSRVPASRGSFRRR